MTWFWGPREKLKGQMLTPLRRAMVLQRLNEGDDWRFVYLKPSHPVYHSYFDFDMAVRDNMPPDLGIDVGDIGLGIGDRLAALLTPRPVTTDTGSEGTGNAEKRVDGTRHLQFAVNTVVNALTQEGGTTQQLMSGVR